MDRKIRVTLADHDANVKTRSGDVWRARVKVKSAQAALETHLLSPNKNAKTVAEHEAAVAVATEAVERAVADWNQAKRDRDALRPDGATKSSASKSSNGPVTNVSERLLAKINRLLVGATHATAPDVDWSADARDSLVDWLMSLDTFYAPAPWTEAEQAVITARATVDGLPVDDATKAMLLATMAPLPTRPEQAAPPVWGTLPETLAAEQAAESDDAAEAEPTEPTAEQAETDAAEQAEQAETEPTDAELAAVAAMAEQAEPSPMADALKQAVKVKRSKAA